MKLNIKQFFMTLLLIMVVSLLGISSESFALNTNISSSSPDKLEKDHSCELTVSTLQGPHYKAGSPLRKEIAKETPGERFILSGKVFDFYDCKPIRGVILDFWQADSNGKYDNDGFDLRGKAISDLNGNYSLETIIPANETVDNTTRPAHIHVKAWIPDNPGDPTLDTQLYFGVDPRMSKSVKDQLILKTVTKNGTKYANFDFGVEDYRDFGEDYLLRIDP